MGEALCTVPAIHDRVMVGYFEVGKGETNVLRSAKVFINLGDDSKWLASGLRGDKASSMSTT